jgi:putative transcriptional regulator
MSEKRIYKIEHLPEDSTDWNAIDKLSDKEINAAALSDPDAQPLSVAKLKKFKRVHPPEEINVKNIRVKLHLSQTAFAAYFGISKRTLQEWEQGRRSPEGAARVLLTVINYEPEAVQRALAHQHY